MRDRLLRPIGMLPYCCRSTTSNFRRTATLMLPRAWLSNIGNNDNKTPLTQHPVTQPLSWIDKCVPTKLQPYFHLMRADKQTGTFLLLYPCLWSTALAAPLGSFPDIIILGKFTIGALIMRSAGCIVNDLWDRDFDRHVERTKSRPLASGAISTTQAMAVLGGQLLAGLGVLSTFNNYSIILGFCSMPLVIAYPLMKRYTNWPQAVLGLAFNWGALMGWAAVHGECSWMHVLPLYAAGVSWTLVYDTIYGYQDRSDDKKLGLRSTSLHFGNNPELILTGFSAVTIVGIGAAGYLADLTLPFYAGLTATGAHLLWQVWTANVNDPKNLWNRFASNRWLGGLVLASIIAGHF